MKQITTLCIAIFLLLSSSAHASPPQLTSKEAEQIIVVLDPGHGGKNLGTLAYNGIYEKEVVLSVALFTEKYLYLKSKEPIRVVLTRRQDVDVPLKDRIQLANDLGASVFVSLHCNSSYDSSVYGIETYILSKTAFGEESRKLSRLVVPRRGITLLAQSNDAAAIVQEMLLYSAYQDSKKLASVIQEKLVKSTKSIDRGVKELPIVVLRGAQMPAVVVELGFLSNPKEAELLTSEKYQKQIAAALADAILAFLKIR